MSLKAIFSFKVLRMLRVQSAVTRKCFASNPKDDVVASAEEKPVFLEPSENEEEIQQMRNKSQLRPQHRNIVLGTKPYEESIEWYHDTVRYKKRTLGRYGTEALGIPAGVAWPTPEEVEDAKEYERVAFPLSLQERWKKLEEKHKQKEEEIMARERELDSNMSKMDKWIREVTEKVAKKEADILAAKQRRQRLIDEVRSQLGPQIPIHDERFKTMLQKKEKEDKKKKKEAKRAAKIEKQMQRLANQSHVDGTPIVDEQLSLKENETTKVNEESAESKTNTE